MYIFFVIGNKSSSSSLGKFNYIYKTMPVVRFMGKHDNFGHPTKSTLPVQEYQEFL
jgi:hypothetical protein